jgi:GTPase Era involved in 16S rRNA processing
MNGLEKITADLLSCKKVFELSNEILANYKVEINQIKLQDALNIMKIDLDDQLKRAKKKEFEIAIIGREKAGKSSLINAWIGFDLLPSDRNRCTYTTTEIRSCVNADEQRYIIEYFTSEEFTKNTHLSEKSLGTSNYFNELREKESEEIKKYSDEISKYLNRPFEMERFANFEEVKAKINSAISYPGHARAVKRIALFTLNLSNKENIVLYDVPGYDSPITLHKDLTKAKIASVDAILYAKQFCSPDLVDCEIEILKISDMNNPFIKAKDKICVALTNCDLANSAKEYQELINSNRKAWRVHGLQNSRIVPVCSLAELNNNNSSETAKVQLSLQNLNGGDTGFKKLKEAVNQCILDAKYLVANDRCNDIKNQCKDFVSQIFECIKQDYNIDIYTDVKNVLDESEMEKIYNEWWAKKWKNIEEDFQSFYHTKIRPKIDPDSQAYLSKEDIGFKELYEKTVEKTFKEIDATKKSRQEAIYVSCIGNDGLIDPKEGKNMSFKTILL